jgi:hypothetical protein
MEIKNKSSQASVILKNKKHENFAEENKGVS